MVDWEQFCPVEPEEAVDESKRDRMVYLNGSKRSFRCDCGANVFRTPYYPERPDIYRCNGCSATYYSEK